MAYVNSANLDDDLDALGEALLVQQEQDVQMMDTERAATEQATREEAAPETSDPARDAAVALRSAHKASPFTPTEATRALIGQEAHESLLTRLRLWAERDYELYTPEELNKCAYAVLNDHVQLAEGQEALCAQLSSLQVESLETKLQGSEILARLEAVEKRLGTSLAATQDATLDILREEVTRLEALVTDLRDKGAVPVGAVVTKESAPNLSGLIGKVPLFSSEKETRCSFETWARLFEDHAKLRGVPEEEWATLAKTNLIGKARERWLQAEATIPNSTEWEVFKGALTPLFSDADKREKAKATYERLKSRGCSQMTEDALQDFGCKFLEAYNDMGPSKPVTEEGALDSYIKGLPSEARAMALLTKSFEPAHFKNLHNAILKVTELACGMVPEISAYHPDRAPARKGKHARGHDSSNGSGPSKKPRMEQAPVVAKTRNELMADPSIRGYADNPKDGKRYSRPLADLLKKENRCLGCRQPGHRLGDCPSPDVPSGIKKIFASTGQSRRFVPKN